MAQRSWDPTLTSQAFWQSWAVAHVGAAAADAVAAVFDSIDSFKTPRPVQWLNGPGGLSRTRVCVCVDLSRSQAQLQSVPSSQLTGGLLHLHSFVQRNPISASGRQSTALWTPSWPHVAPCLVL